MAKRETCPQAGWKACGKTGGQSAGVASPPRIRPALPGRRGREESPDGPDRRAAPPGPLPGIARPEPSAPACMFRPVICFRPPLPAQLARPSKPPVPRRLPRVPVSVTLSRLAHPTVPPDPSAGPAGFLSPFSNGPSVPCRPSAPSIPRRRLRRSEPIPAEVPRTRWRQVDAGRATRVRPAVQGSSSPRQPAIRARNQVLWRLA